jgi:hypothetical protein
MMKDLKAKTQSLKFERRLRQITERHALPIASEPCNCKAWLKKQVRKQAPVKKVNQLPSRPAMVLIASAAPKNHRNSDYNRRFEQGSACWYHIPATSLQRYDNTLIESIRYCALGTTATGMGERSANYLWAVHSVQLVPRHILTVEQAGSLKASDEPYWLFELGESVSLANPITDFPAYFSAIIAPAMALIDTSSFTALAEFKDASHD